MNRLKIRTTVTVLLVITIAAAKSVSAQPTHRFEAFGVGGVAQLWDDESSLGAGPAVGGGVAVRLTDRVAVEALVDSRSNDRRFVSDVRFSADIVRVTGRVLRYFRDAVVQPYVGGSFGFARIRRENEFPDDCGFGSDGQYRCLSTLRGSSSDSSGALGGVVGVRWRLAPRFFVRPEFETVKAGEYLMMGGSVSAGFDW